MLAGTPHINLVQKHYAGDSVFSLCPMHKRLPPFFYASGVNGETVMISPGLVKEDGRLVVLQRWDETGTKGILP